MTPLRPLQPREADRRKWRRLVREARWMAEHPRASAGDLRAAAATARKAVAPSRELLLAVCSPLIRLAEAWPTLDDQAVEAAAGQLAELAERLAPHVGTAGPRPPSPSGAALDVPEVQQEDADDRLDVYQREPRRDVFG